MLQPGSQAGARVGLQDLKNFSVQSVHTGKSIWNFLFHGIFIRIFKIQQQIRQILRRPMVDTCCTPRPGLSAGPAVQTPKPLTPGLGVWFLRRHISECRGALQRIGRQLVDLKQQLRQAAAHGRQQRMALFSRGR